VELTSSQFRGRLLRLTARLRIDGLARKNAGDQPPQRTELFGG
jgi:hypothetical protein